MPEDTITTQPSGPSGGSSGVDLFNSPSQSAPQQERKVQIPGFMPKEPGQQQDQPQQPKPQEPRPPHQAQEPRQPQQPAQPQLSQEQQQIVQQMREQGASTEEIVKAIREGFQQAAQPPKQETPYTEEQFYKDMGVVRLDKEVFDAMFGVDASPDQVETLNDLMFKMAVAGARMADVRINKQINALRQELSPLQQSYQKISNQAHEAAFFKQFPHLNKYGSMVRMAQKMLESEGAKFQSPGEAYKAIASRAAAELKQVGINVQPQAQQPGQAPQQPAPRQTRRPAAVSLGGGGGTNTPGSSPQQGRPSGIEVF